MKKIDTFKVLANVAKSTRNPADIQNALRFGIENRVGNANIRKFLN